MAAAVVLSASIVAGPQGGGCGYPSTISNIAFGTTPPELPAGVIVSHAKQVNSPAAFVTLDGIGSGATVTQGNFLYVKTNAAMQLRLTFADAGPDIVSILQVAGPLVFQIPASGYLKLLEAKGVGAIEYLVSGNL